VSLIATDNVILIAGGGITGLSVARYLSKIDRRFCVYDSRDEDAIARAVNNIDESAACYLGQFRSSYLNGVSGVVISPGISMDTELVRQAQLLNIPIKSEIKLFLESTSARVIGITGSNGKSTVTTIVGLAAKHAGLRCAVGGNLGVPALDLLSDDVDLYVLELSSFQLETTEDAGLFVAAHLNLSPDHLDRHGTMHEYFRIKQKIFHSAKRVVYKLSEPLTQPPRIESVKRYGFGLSGSVEKNEEQFSLTPDKKQLVHDGVTLMHASDIKQKGAHNTENILAAFAIAEAAEIPSASVAELATSFTGLTHRCEWVTEYRGVTFINDSKATNVGAASAALKGFAYEERPIVLIAGGEGKGADFSELAKIIVATVKSMVLIGEDASAIGGAVGSRVPTHSAKNLSEAVDISFQQAESGDIVLFSPACASFDMFANFEARGEAFKQTVMELSA